LGSQGSRLRAALLAISFLITGAGPGKEEAGPSPLLSEIDRLVRERYFDSGMRGVDWEAAVRRAGKELERAPAPGERDAVFDRLLATLGDSHTFRMPPGRLPEKDLATAGLRIGREGQGYAVKGVLPGTAAERVGMKIGDRVVAVDGRAYDEGRVSFRELFLVFEGAAGSSVQVTWRPAGEAEPRTDRLTRSIEEPGDRLVWRSVRVIRRGDRAYGYARLWGINAETALAVVDLLLDREAAEKAGSAPAGWSGIEGFLLDARANSGGYDPNILATFLRGRWSAGDYYVRTREGRKLKPPLYAPLPVALLVNSGTASAGESLALKFRKHDIGPIVGEETAGMASGGAGAHPLSDGSTLWITAYAIEDQDGRRYEGRGVEPDVRIADRLAARAGEEDAIVEAGIAALAGRKPEAVSR
jgi:C-terminal processing protease CtpA/Prc